MPGLIDRWNESSPRQLRIFVSLAQSLKFSRTADHFCVAQPTLSNIVREIEEEEVGIRLFERTTRSVKLTAALQKSVTDPEVRSRLDGMGVAAVTADQATPAALRAHLRREIDTLGGLLVKAGVKAN